MIKNIHIHNAHLEVHSSGKVYRVRGATKRRIGSKKGKYEKYSIWNKETKRCEGILIHRIVAMAFLDDYDDNLVVDHIDNNARNNSVNNLRMVTQAQNIQLYWAEQAPKAGIVTNKMRLRDKRLKKIPSHGFLGISKNLKKDKYIAQVRVGEDRISGGMFESEIDAACAANKIMVENNKPIESINTPLMAHRFSSFEGSKLRLSRAFHAN